MFLIDGIFALVLFALFIPGIFSFLGDAFMEFFPMMAMAM